jgi:hypothetical protein
MNTKNPSSNTQQTQSQSPHVQFLRPSQIKGYQPPPGALLIGDHHIVKGSVVVIGGAPSVGKSRALVAMAEAGATQFDWFGLSVHRKFKTMLLQSENGQYRLRQEFAQLDEKILDPWVLISPPPPFGLCFWRKQFCAELRKAIDDFRPDIIAIDPWTGIIHDQGIGDFLDAFAQIRSVIPCGDDSPAIVIAAHTRKPQRGERTNGRALLHTLAGSYVLGSIARCAWVLQNASDDADDKRVVVTCCKNNDGEEGPRTVWERDNGLWTAVTGFDFAAWDAAGPLNGSNGNSPIDETDMEDIFAGGCKLTKKEAVAALKSLTGKEKTVCYEALNLVGKFRGRLRYDKTSNRYWWH